MRIPLFLILVSLCSIQYLNAQQLYYPPIDTDDWESLAPDQLGWNLSWRDSLLNYAEKEQTYALILLKDGRIVIEEYFGDFRQDSLSPWFSAGKSLMASLIGIAQNEGVISIEDESSTYLGKGWTSLTEEQENKIKIRHQISMTTGLDERFFNSTDPGDLQYFAEAGTRWVYHNGPYSLLRNVLEQAYNLDLNIITNRKIEQYVGMSGFWISTGDVNIYYSTAREMARYALLVQSDGIWDGTAVVKDTAYFRQMISTSQQMNPSYGYLWWLNGKVSHILPGGPESYQGSICPNSPEDMIAAAGKNGQLASISKEMGLVLVRMGDSEEEDRAGLDLLDGLWSRTLNMVSTETGIHRTEIPSQVELYQNYPNPFNPVTTITYRLESAGRVKINIYDARGRLVRILSDEYQAAGKYSIAFDASDLASGAYFYTLRSGDFAATKKMILLR